VTAPPASIVLLGLAWFAAINLVASASIRRIARMVLPTAAGRRGGALLALRLLPSAVSTVFVTAFFAPAHWRFEPADSQESFGVVLCGLGFIGAALLARSASRMLAVAHAGWRLRACRRLAGTDRAAGVYEVAGFPGVSLAGVLRTRILVGAAVRQTLSAEELDVALAHERAHRTAFDNLKRFVMFCAPDLLGGSAVSRELEARWRATAEWRADDRAVNGDQVRAVRLASALVKVSRLASGPAPFAMSAAWSRLHDAPLLEFRVRRLVHGRPPAVVRPHRALGLSFAALAAVALVSASVSAAPSVQQLTEALVRLLP